MWANVAYVVDLVHGVTQTQSIQKRDFLPLAIKLQVLLPYNKLLKCSVLLIYNTSQSDTVNLYGD